MKKIDEVTLPLLAQIEVQAVPAMVEEAAPPAKKTRRPPTVNLSTKRINSLLDTADRIRNVPAIDDKAISYMARVLVQATMPHSNPGDVRAWGRSNGHLSMSIEPGYIITKRNEAKSIGLPYGSIPRLLLFWVTSEAFKLRSRKLSLGNSLASFMRQVGLDPSTGGGPRSDAARLKEQMKRLFSARIAFNYDEEGRGFGRQTFTIADKVQLWWNPIQTDSDSLFQSEIELGEKFYNEIIERPVPVDMRALSELKQSPMALDLYAWLTYRVSYLKKPASISWEQLQEQLGADYAEVRSFRFKVRQHLHRIVALYPELIYEDTDRGLVLHPSPTHVPKLPA